MEREREGGEGGGKVDRGRQGYEFRVCEKERKMKNFFSFIFAVVCDSFDKHKQFIFVFIIF
jgi:hypothetical protein